MKVEGICKECGYSTKHYKTIWHGDTKFALMECNTCGCLTEELEEG